MTDRRAKRTKIWDCGTTVNMCRVSAKILKHFMALEIFVTQNHMELEISKCYSSYTFHPIWAKLYDKYGSHRRIKVMYILAICQKIKNLVALWNFNMEVNVKILKCAISQKRLIVERNGRQFGTRSTTVHILRVLLMPNSLSLVWGHSVHFEKFTIPRFSKHYSFNSFHQISNKLQTKYHSQGLI